MGGLDGYWDDTANWSASSGGAPGASFPTSSDNVQLNTFDANISLRVDAECADLTISPFASSRITVAGGSTISVSIYGSLYLAGQIWCDTYFRATSPGKTIQVGLIVPQSAGVTFDGVGGEWTLLNDLTPASNEDAGIITVKNGSFVSGNFDITCVNGFNSNFSSVRSISLGSSEISIAGPWDISTTTNLTWNAGSSLINYFNASHSKEFRGGGLTYYDLRIATNIALVFDIYGSNTFRNLTGFNFDFNANHQIRVEAGTTQTINGTFTLNGKTSSPSADFTGTPLSGISPLSVVFTNTSNLGNTRLKSLTQGSTYTISANIASVSRLNVEDSIATGTAAPFNNSTGGIDAGNNTGWTFPANSVVYAWDFKNDGSALSSSKNPIYIYTNPGVYSVKLTVTTVTGSNSKTRVNYVTVNSLSLAVGTLSQINLNLTPGSKYKLIFDISDATNGLIFVRENSELIGSVTVNGHHILLFTSIGGNTLSLSASTNFSFVVDKVSLRELKQAAVDDNVPIKEFLTGTTDEGRPILFRADTQNIQLLSTFETFSNPTSIVNRIQRGVLMKCFVSIDSGDFYEIEGTASKGVSILKVHSQNRRSIPTPPIARKMQISWRDGSLQLCRLIQSAIVFTPSTMESTE